MQGTRPKRTGARTAQTGLVRGFWVLRPGLPALEGQKKAKSWKCAKLVTWGRDRKRSSTHPPPSSARLVLQCSTFVSPSRSQTKKNFRHNRGQKSVFKGVGAGNLKKKKTNTSLDADFSPILYLTFPSFHRAPYHWTTIIPSYGFSNRAEKKNGYYNGY